MSDNIKATIVWIVCWTIAFIAGCIYWELSHKYETKELKCIQGELYEEVKDNIFVKSYLECFEQRTLTP